jgi:hypothetical protein
MAAATTVGWHQQQQPETSAARTSTAKSMNSANNQRQRQPKQQQPEQCTSNLRGPNDSSNSSTTPQLAMVACTHLEVVALHLYLEWTR